MSRTFLLTGAAGVVGQTVLADPPAGTTVALAHRARPAALDGVPTRIGDITESRLGLNAAEYRELATSVDAVVHSAALTDVFGTAREMLHRVNVEGTENVLQFARDADAHLYYVSTAWVDAPVPERAEEETPGDLVWAYVRTKREAEARVEQGGVPVTIIRPSIVIGHTATGFIPRFQGIYLLTRLIFEDGVTTFPVAAASRFDFVPADVLMASMRAILDAPAPAPEYWLTAGEQAPQAGMLLEVAAECAAGLGRPMKRPRLVDPDVVDRLFRPVFLPALPRREQLRFEQLSALAPLFFTDHVFPSSLAQLTEDHGLQTNLDMRRALQSSIMFWAHEQGYGVEGPMGSREPGS